MTKFSALPEDTNPTGNDYVATVDAESGANKRVKLSNMKTIFVTLEEEQTLENKKVVKRISRITTSTNPTPNADTMDELFITALESDMTLGAPTGDTYDGQVLIIRIKATSSQSRAISYHPTYRGINVTPPTTITAGQLIYIAMKYNEPEDKWDILSVARS